MKKISGKILSFVLVALMIVSLIPSLVYAAGYTVTACKWLDGGDYYSGTTNVWATISDGTTKMTGICANPTANPPSVGSACTITATSDKTATGLAYLASQNAGDNSELWLIHHAISYYWGFESARTEWGSNWTKITNYIDKAKSVSVPSNFQAVKAVPGLASEQVMLAWYTIPYGSATLVKKSDAPSVTNGNTYYSLANAVYTVYSNSACTAKVGELTTKADGTSNTLTNLTAGTYYVKETTAPKGFDKDTTRHDLVVQAGKTATLTVTDYHQKGPVSLVKVSSAPDITDGNSNYDLAGAEYTIYKNNTDGKLSGSVGTLTTKSNGESNSIKVDYGKYYAQETTAPKGYKLNDKIITIVVNNPDKNVFEASDTPESGSINLLKVSANEEVTKNNSCYSFKGAEYGVYKEQSCKTQLGVLTTGENGKSNTLSKMPLGKVWVKELSAPPGYELDDTPVSATIKKDETITVNVKDEPNGDPVAVMVSKIDSKTGLSVAQGDLSLEGAEYTVKFYAGQYSTAAAAEASGTLQRTWILKTDKTGYCRLSDKYLVSGDAFYYIDGIIELPLGTVTIEETTAPFGYKLDKTVYVRNITEDGASGEVISYNEPTSPEVEDIYGGLEIVKNDIDLKTAQAQGAATLEGAKYQIINKSENPVYVDGKTVDVGGVCYTLTTDAKGAAKTPTNLLPYGTYKIVEVEASNGYLIAGSTEQTFKIEGNGQIVKLDTQLTETPIRGGVKIQKQDSVTGTTAQGDGTLKDAKFNIITLNDNPVVVSGKTYNKNDVVKTLTTDADGFAETSKNLLPFGKYKVVEVEAPEGYLIEGDTEATFSITTDGKIVSLVGDMNDDAIMNHIEIVKCLTGEGKTGNERPEVGAVFQVYLTSAGSYDAAKDSERDTITTDEDGFAATKDLPYGHYTVHQVSGTEGFYFVDDFSVYIKDSTPAKPYRYILNDRLFTGFVHVTKTDADTGEVIPVEGIGFQMKDPDGNLITFWGADTWYTDKNGEIRFPVELPYGYNYSLIELNAPEGYVLPTEPFYFDITPDTATEENELVVVNFTVKNISTSTELSKKDVAGDELPGAEMTLLDKNGKVVESWISTDTPHIIRKLPVGETFTLHEDTSPLGFCKATDITFTVADTTELQKVEMTDKVVTVSKEDFMGTEVPGASLTVIDKNGKTVDSWISTDEPHAINNLTVGETYTLHEEAAPTGWLVATDVEFTVKDDGVDQVVVMEDEEIPEIGTTATVGGIHMALATEKTTLVDTVHYEKLVPGREYTLTGKLMDKDTGKAVKDSAGKEITAETKFTAADRTGDVDVTFVFDTSDLAGHTTVAFEDLYRNGRLYCTHSDINDDEQTVHIPDIGTTASVLDKPVALATEDVVLKDIVAYENLIPGNEYKVTGTLMDKDTGKAVKDANGKEITSETTFTAKEANGTVEVSFKFDASAMAGKSVVAFENIYYKDILVAAHIDINDEDQTIHIPEIGTTATVKDNHVANAVEDVTLTDVVAYKNLVPGREYKVTGVLMNKATGEAMKNADGSEITAETTFTAKKADGSVEVTFKFDATNMAGMTTVVFEDLYDGDVMVATHADINDDDQTIHFPEIHTTATVDKEHLAMAKEIELVDTVNYKNLIVGKDYTVTGTLMLKDTGKAVKDADGKEITSSVTFTAEQPDGSIDVTFKFDASSLAGKSIVAFEDMTNEDILVATHADLEDEDQTVHIPEIGTKATVDGKDSILVNDEMDTIELVDTVSYKNLIVGKEYTVNGTLMDKLSGKAVKDADGKEITATTTFTAETADGTVEVVFTVPAAAVMGTKTVVFESLVQSDREIAIHADIDDEGQTTTFYEEVKILKKDASDYSVIKGAEIRVTDNETGEKWDIVSGDDGYAVFGALLGHSYTYKETKAPEGYSTNKEEYTITVSEDGEISGDSILWNIKLGTVVITKTDVISGEPVMGAEVTVYDKNGKEVFKQETDKYGRIYFYPPAAGEYTYKETKTAEGYYINTDTFHLTVTGNGEDFKAKGDLSFTDVPIGTVVITKYAEDTNLPLSGCKVGVYDEAGNLLWTGLTDENGRCYFVSPHAGKYYFVEVEAPKGYLLNTDKFYFAIGEDGVITGTTTLYDTPDTPQTGDHSNMAVWGGTAGASALAIAGAAILASRKRKEENSDC